MHSLLILSRNAAEYRRLIEAAALPGLGEITFEAGPGCEIVFGEPDRIRAALPQLPALNWAQATWAGVEPLLDPSLRRDYTLTNARGVFGGLMSEYVIGYLLMHERKMLPRLAAQLQRKWDTSLTGTLRGKSLGLLGVGSIGAELARAAKFFGMTVRGYTLSSETSADVDQYFHGEQLLDFASGLDYLVSVLPNTPQTNRIVSADLIARLPARALFVNVGRGSAVDESALIQALETEAISGAVLDVFEQEPLPEKHPFWSTKNLLLTFHTSAPSFPAEISQVFIENYRLYQAGQPLQHRVDFERGY